MRLVYRNGISSRFSQQRFRWARSGPPPRSRLPNRGTWTVSPFLATTMGISDDHGAGNSMVLGVGIGYDLTSVSKGEIGHFFDVAGDSENIDLSVTKRERQLPL